MNRKAEALSADWLYWLQTRRFMGPPPPAHILAVMSEKNKPSREPPNAPLSAEMSAFHLGVIGLPPELGRPFLRVYCKYPNAPVKTLAYSEGIDRSSYYDRAHQGAAQALSSMNHILTMVSNLGLVKV